LKMVMA
jgi:hypothetical protein